MQSRIQLKSSNASEGLLSGVGSAVRTSDANRGDKADSPHSGLYGLRRCLRYMRLACASTAETAVPQVSSSGAKIFNVSYPLNLVRLLSVGVLAWGMTGCAQLNNPYKDSSAAIDSEMTTASAEGYQGKAEFPSSLRRTWAAADVYYENGSVTHWPLAFEDPFENKGNRFATSEDRDAPDNVFAWNALDYFHFVYGPSRMFINILGFAGTLAVTPPGMVMESNGQLDKGLLGYDYDSKRSVVPTREPPDVSRINKDLPDVPDEPEEATEATEADE